MNNIHQELLIATNNFFENIFTSKEMQEDYELLRNDNGQLVLNILKDFRDNKNFSLTKPFYENDYKNSSVPRVMTVKRDSNGFIICSILNMPEFPAYPIEPRFLVSIIFQSIEDEAIKREMYQTKEKEKETPDMEL